jgi:hypothetical protein
MLFLATVVVPHAKAQDWNITWTKVNDSLSHKTYEIEVQNLNDTDKRDFYLGIFFKDDDALIDPNLNFSIYNMTNVWLYEWKILEQQIPIYDTKETNATCWRWDEQLQQNITWNCTITEQYMNGTVTKNVTSWKPTKMKFVQSLLNDLDSYTSQLGTINIPKFGSKCKEDDLGNEYDCNGTKKFKLEFDLPIINNTGGFSASGLVGLYDYNNNEEFHPPFNSSWMWRRPITIDNTNNPNTLYDYVIPINLTYEDAMNPDFSDVRFTWLNTTPDPQEEIEIPYWIEKKVNSQWAYIWVKVKEIPASNNATIYVYFANPFATTTTSIGKDTFLIFDDFDDGDLNLTMWTMVNNQTNSPIYEKDGYLELTCNAGTDCDLSPSADSAPHVHLNLTDYNNYEFIGRMIAENYNETRHGMFIMNKSFYENAGMVLFERHNTTEGTINLTQEISSPDIGFPVDVESWNYNEFTLSIVRNDTNKVNLGYSSDVSGMNYIGDFNISADYAGFQGKTPNSTEGYSTLHVDYAFVRNYSSPEPTYIIGEPEDDPPSYLTDEQMGREICKDASGNLHMVYSYNTTNIGYSKSSDGIAWTTNISFYGGTSTSSSTKKFPSISCDGNNITIVYNDYTYQDIIVGVSEDNGNTWRFSTPVTSNGCRYPNVERRGQNIYLVYNYGTATCEGSGTWEEWFIRSLDAGNTWINHTRLMYHTSYDYFSVSMAVDGNGSSTDKVYIAGHYYPSTQYIYFINSTNAGENFPSCNMGSSPQCVQVLTASGVANHPTITYYGSNIYIASHDTNAFEIWYTNSTNSGIAWTAQIRIDLTGATTARALYPKITLDNKNNPVIIWADNTTHPNFDIVLRRYNGTGWDSSLVYLTNDADGNGEPLSAPYKYYNDNKIHFFYTNGTSAPYQIIYGYYLIAIAPSWQNQGQTNDTIFNFQSNNLYAQWSDANGLAYAWLETNETGQWKNQTPTKFSSNPVSRNNTWNRCRNLTISNIFTPNSPVSLNITGLSFINATKEIRIMNSSCNNDGVQVEFDIIDDSGNIGDGSEWVRVVFPASNNTTYSIYYDNPSAVEDTSLRLENEDIWNDYYNATVTPNLATKAWTKEAGSGASITIVSDDGQLRLNETTASQYLNWGLFDSSISHTTGTTAEWTFKVTSTPTRADKASGQISIADGVRQPYMYYNKTHVWSGVSPYETFAVDFTDYHIVRISIGNSNNASVYIDNVYVGTIVSSTNVNKYYNFLVYDANQVTYWDYATYTRLGNFTPASVSVGNEVSADGWYNYAWQNRKNIKVISDSSSKVKEPIIANITSITYTNISKEGRLIDGFGNPVKFDIIDQADNWVRIIFPYTGSANQTFYFYYNNPSATEDPTIRLSDYDIWNDYYNATVSPLSATLAWVNVTTGTITQAVISDNGVQKLNISFGVNGYLHWSRSGSPEWSSLYILKIDPSTGTGSFSNPSGYISLQGGGKAFEFDFNKTHIWNAYVTTQIVAVPQFTQRYVVFQVNRSANSSANLFIDGQLAMNVAGSASAGTQLVFATGSGTTNGGIIYWDAVSYNSVSNTSSPLGTELGAEESQWYNYSWLNRKRIIVVSDGITRIKEPIVTNITGLTFANITKEARLIDSSNQEALFDIIQNGSNWAKIIFPVNISNTNLTYYFYYSNPNADEPNHWLKNTSVWEEFYNASQLPSATFWKSELGAGAINTIQTVDGFSRLNVTAVGNAQYQGWYRQPAVTSSRTSEVAFKIDPASSNVQYLGYLVLVMGGGTANNGIQINFNKTHLYSTTGTYTECAVNLTANYVNIRSLINGTIYVNNTFCMNVGKFTNPNSQIYLMTRPSSGTSIVYWDYFGYNATTNSTPLTSILGDEETQLFWSNFTWQNTSFYGVVAWRIYANDSLNVEGVTNIKTFFVTVTQECNMTINFTSVSFGMIEHSTTNNPANNNYSVSANASQSCSCKISWSVPNPQLTYLGYTIGSQNLKLNWTQDGSPHANLELRNSIVNVSVSNNTKSMIYPKYYLDIPYLQHTGDYQGTEIISSSCA